MIPVLHRGEFVQCGPEARAWYLKHCPVCDRAGAVEAGDVERWLVHGGPVDSITCPHCGDSADLLRMLEVAQ